MIESEKVLEKKLRIGIEEKGGFCFKLLTQYVSGLPDRICLLPGGIIFFAEIKTTKKKPEKLQKIIHRKLREIGFEVFVIDSSKQINDILNEKFIV